MPELPEVQTTVNGLKEHVIGLKITDIWSDYNSPYFKGSETIKDATYFKHFKKEIVGAQIISVSRRAKNILVHVSGKTYRNSKCRSTSKSIKNPMKPNVFGDKTILIHMKMTGHLLYGRYKFYKSKQKDPWEPIEPESLKDPFNRHIHFVISFSNKKHLALSDVRKFAKVTLIDCHSPHDSDHLNTIGPEPLDESFSFEKFRTRLFMRKNGKIKQVLMDQSIIAGIGNIYADESLWHASIHPLEKVIHIPEKHLKSLFNSIKKTLSRGISFGGDSMSDYRNVDGEKGVFQEKHHAYRRTGSKCDKKGCNGTIVRIVLGTRGTHFCSEHQRARK